MTIHTERCKAMTEKCVDLLIENDIAFVTLNRPEKRNALDMEMFRAIDSVSRQLRRNRKIRAVIVQGKVRIFAAAWTSSPS